MKTAISACIALLLTNTLFAQQSLPRWYINPAVGFFRLTTDKASFNTSPLMLDVKAGIYLKKNSSLGLQFSGISQTVQVSGISSLQPGSGGSQWTKHGTLKHVATAFGFFYERYLFQSGHFSFFPTAYAQYLHYVDEENGYIIVGNDSSTRYRSGTLHKYIGRVGVNFNMQYDIYKSVSVTLRFAQIDCRIWNKHEQNIFVEMPVLFGVKCFFN